jgi:predicted transcriptional regulator
MDPKLIELVTNEKTRKPLLVALGIQNNLPYTSKDIQEYLGGREDTINQALDYLVSLGIARKDEPSYRLNVNPNIKRSVVSQLRHRGISVPPIIAGSKRRNLKGGR